MIDQIFLPLDAQERALQATIKDLETRMCTGVVGRMADEVDSSVDIVSSGWDKLDKALGIGGYPMGRIVEIYGGPATGKTTLAIQAVVSVQQSGGTAVYVDVEHALDPAYCTDLGVDTDALLLSRPRSGEEALNITESMIRSGAVRLVVVDSVAALVPKAEMSGRIGDNYVGHQARLMSQAMRKLTTLAHQNGVLLMFTNQLRLATKTVNNRTMQTVGGAALQYYATVRLELANKGLVYENANVVGSQVRIKIVKNKVSTPFQVVEGVLRYGLGLRGNVDAPDF